MSLESYYPVMLNVQGRRCLVAGGGPVAQRKVQGLLECGAEVVLVSPAVTPSLAELARQGMILLLAREYESGDLTGSMLVFALTNQRQVNAKIAEEAARAGIPVNVADEAEEGDFILPAVVRRGPLVLTVSTSGASPAYAGRIKDELAERYDEDLISYVAGWEGFAGISCGRSQTAGCDVSCCARPSIARPPKIWKTKMKAGLFFT